MLTWADGIELTLDPTEKIQFQLASEIYGEDGECNLDSEFLVILHLASTSDKLIEELIAHGLAIQRGVGTLIQGSLGCESLDEIIQLPFVTHIRKPLEPTNTEV